MAASSPQGRTSKAGALLVLLSVVALVVVGLQRSEAGAQLAPPDVPPADRGGSAQILGESGEPLSEGGSATIFSIRLPDGAACQGDSANENYRVKSFLVPEGTDLAALRYAELTPVGENTWSLWDENTNPYVAGFTSDAPEGQPGLISGLPRFRFDVLFPGELPAGSYRIGIACSLFETTTRYWDTSFVVVEDANDQPAQFRWTTDRAESTSDGDSAGSTLLVAGIAVAAVVLVVATLIFRRRTPADHPHKEQRHDVSV